MGYCEDWARFAPLGAGFGDLTKFWAGITRTIRVFLFATEDAPTLGIAVTTLAPFVVIAAADWAAKTDGLTTGAAAVW